MHKTRSKSKGKISDDECATEGSSRCRLKTGICRRRARVGGSRGYVYGHSCDAGTTLETKATANITRLSAVPQSDEPLHSELDAIPIVLSVNPPDDISANSEGASASIATSIATSRCQPHESETGTHSFALSNQGFRGAQLSIWPSHCG